MNVLVKSSIKKPMKCKRVGDITLTRHGFLQFMIVIRTFYKSLDVLKYFIAFII